MKYLTITFLSLLLFLAVSASAAPTFAIDTVAPTYVAGKVTTSGNPVNGASVVVTCNAVVLNTTTNASGDYAVQYAYTTCPDGTLAHATATKNGQSGSGSSTVNHFGAPINIDIAIINPVIPVPEFGFLPYAIAALGSAGAFLKLRKKV